MADEEQNGKKRISRSARLPQHGFEAIRKLVQALADLAAPATKERIAEQLGIAAKGRFLGKLAAARYYGFIEQVADSKWQLTERGRAFLGGDEEAKLRAMREGVMRTSYGQIIFLLRSEAPKDGVLQIRLQDDAGVPADSAEAVATILVAVSKEAQLIGENGRFSSSAIEDTRAALQAAGDEPAKVTPPPKAEPTAPKRTPALKQTNGKPADPAQQSPNGGGKSDPLVAAPVEVVVNVDASKLSPQEIAELVRALREPPPKTTS